MSNMVMSRFLETDEIWSEKVRCSSNMKPRFRAERVVVSEELWILRANETGMRDFWLHCVLLYSVV